MNSKEPMPQDEISPAEREAAEIDNRYDFIGKLIGKEIIRTKGKLTESAGNIFADMIEETMDQATVLDVPFDAIDFFETFMPTIALAPDGSALNKIGVAAVQEFYEGRWKEDKAKHVAGICYCALVTDDLSMRSMPMPLATTLNELYCDQMSFYMKHYESYQDNENNLEEQSIELEDDIDTTCKFIDHFTNEPKQLGHLQSLLVSQERRFAIIKEDMGEGAVSLVRPIETLVTAALKRQKIHKL